MVTRRELIITLGAGALVPHVGIAQQPPAKVARIGLLGAEAASVSVAQVNALRTGLLELGYAEGKNIVIEFRWAEGKYDRLPDLATELVSLKTDVLVTLGTKAAFAAKHATTTIPIVFSGTSDAVGSGLVASLARPGGNITGLSFLGPEVMVKRLELLKQAKPSIKKVAVLVNPDNSGYGPALQTMRVTAKSLKLELQLFEARRPDEIEHVFSAMVGGRVNAIVSSDDTIFSVNIKKIADLATKQRLPSIGLSGFAEAGGLISYASNTLERIRRTAYFVDKILKGTKPGDLPVERPTKFDLVVNMKTAKVLRITIPQSILVQATKIIE